jgi:5-methylcytosine-specific restriction endonuclease McrA
MMRLCRACQSKMPEQQKGLCDACSGSKKPVVSDGIRSNVAVRNDGAYDDRLDALRKDRRWREQVQPRIVKRDPMCKRCDVAPTAIVDHIVPAAEAIRQVKEDGRFGPAAPNAGYYLESNLQGLCAACHGAKTAEDKQRTEPWPSVMEAHDKLPKKVWSF